MFALIAPKLLGLVLGNWKWLAIGLAVLALLGGVYAKGRGDGRHGEQRAQTARVEAARKAVVKIETKAAAITTEVAAKSEARQVQIRTVTQTITREVPVYVTAETDRRFPLSAGFVRLYDASAAGSLSNLPDTASVSDGEASTVTASEAARVMVANNGQCLGDQARLSDLQEWLRRQIAVHAP